MASSRKSSRSRSRNDLPARLADRLAAVVRAGDRLMVGLSGGVDSVVLLHALKAVTPRLRLSALHVNHRLSPNAPRWAAFCRRYCRALGVPLSVETVRVTGRGGTEAAARRARYAAYARHDCDYVLLAHHQDDQVETLLLQLLRGAGVKGLAGMSLLREQAGDAGPSSPGILRPMLDITRREILDYARAHGLEWIDDESNADTRYARNYLRHEVLPRVARRFPGYRAAVAASARLLADAARVLDETAARDGVAPGGGESLPVTALRRLTRGRARNVLRAFIAGHGIALPGAPRLEEALRQALEARDDARVRIELDGASLRRHAGALYLVRGRVPPAAAARVWRGQRRMVLDELGGVLTLAPARGEGISLARLRAGRVTVGARRGGERMRPDIRRPRRALKKLLQEAGVPPWQRERLPLLFCGEALVWAHGVGIDCDFQAALREPALVPGWSGSRTPSAGEQS